MNMLQSQSQPHSSSQMGALWRDLGTILEVAGQYHGRLPDDLRMSLFLTQVHLQRWGFVSRLPTLHR